MFMIYVGAMILALPTIAVALFLIYRLVGVATFVGLGMIIITMPMNGMVFGVLNAVRTKMMVKCDMRVKLMNELLSGIRVLKFYAWEEAFRAKVEAIRHEQCVFLKKIAFIVAVFFTLVLQAVPVFMPVLIFYTYVKLGHTLDAAKAFTAISLFNLMQFPFIFLPMGLAQYSQSLVSLKRLMKFFAADELKPYIQECVQDGVAVEMKGATVGWVDEPPAPAADGGAAVPGDYAKVSQDEGKAVDLESSPAAQVPAVHRSVETLKDVTLSIKKGELVAIIGPVGCGKSTFLSGILGELNLLSGSIAVNGSIAYCDQRPWILNDSVQGNILFGQEMKEAQFDEALYASCLEEDIRILPGGLQTQIGEKGINLSGGQKARVALARAVYKAADIYLLDDPLSAVDAHVAHFLFHECICRSLKGKTRLLVTHHVHLLPHCDKIIVLVDGQVKIAGTYADVMASGIDLKALTPKKDDDKQAEAEVVEAEAATVTENAVEVSVEDTDEKHFASMRETAQKSASLRKKDYRSTTLISKEEREEGAVDASCYWYLIKAGGVGMFSCFLLTMTASLVLVLLASYWLQYWGTNAARHEDNDPFTSEQNVWYLNIYAALSAGNLVFYMLRSLFLAEHRMGASELFHTNLLKSTLHAPVAFFDTTPVGRILNRFSSDMRTVDEELSHTMSQLSNATGAVVSAIAAIAGATKGTFLILMIPLLWFYQVTQKYFRATNTSIARLESLSRSPIYADFSQALTGMTTVRAYKEQQRFMTSLEDAVNQNSIATMSQQLAAQWLALRLDLIGSSISFFIAAVAAATTGFIPAGFVALGLSYSFQLTTYLKYNIKMLATMEAQMNAVERIMHYTNNIEQEQSTVPGMKATLPPASWPEQGVIEVANLQMRYRDGPLVLKDVSFLSKSCEKIGIAGRTGSGKSSLMIALFRIQELAGGSIVIDGIDTGTIPLHILRSRLGIIPQDPVMFSASVRFNLDPFDQYSDEAIWDMLDRVQMKDHVMGLPGQLLEIVAEGGDNFSMGQRQLICIGRAVLRKPKILLLDEATASIDNENDQVIQQMVRAQFQECTVLTIAHRLHTIIDSDR